MQVAKWVSINGGSTYEYRIEHSPNGIRFDCGYNIGASKRARNLRPDTSKQAKYSQRRAH